MITYVDRLFLLALDDLEQKIASGDGYETLGASRILRQLFFDEPPLVDQVNRERRVRLQFQIAAHVFPDRVRNALGYWEGDGLDPDTAPPGPPSVRTRDQFLAQPVLLQAGVTYSIADIIKFEANVMGGVHASPPREEKHKALAAVGNMFHVQGLPGSLAQLQAIGRVVLRALKPLRDQISAEQASSRRTIGC